MGKDQDYNIYQNWIQQCEESDKLTEWEDNFVKSVKKFLEDRGFLSKKQADILERIYADKT